MHDLLRELFATRSIALHLDLLGVATIGSVSEEAKLESKSLVQITPGYEEAAITSRASRLDQHGS